MAFGKTRSNLQAEIDDQKDFIQECLEEVSVLLDKRNSEVERMITIQAKEEAQGDAEIESSIISNYISCFPHDFVQKNHLAVNKVVANR